jgi:hypothetical protein
MVKKEVCGSPKDLELAKLCVGPQCNHKCLLKKIVSSLETRYYIPCIIAM